MMNVSWMTNTAGRGASPGCSRVGEMGTWVQILDGQNAPEYADAANDSQAIGSAKIRIIPISGLCARSGPADRRASEPLAAHRLPPIPWKGSASAPSGPPKPAATQPRSGRPPRLLRPCRDHTDRRSARRHFDDRSRSVEPAASGCLTASGSMTARYPSRRRCSALGRLARTPSSAAPAGSGRPQRPRQPGPGPRCPLRQQSRSAANANGFGQQIERVLAFLRELRSDRVPGMLAQRLLLSDTELERERPPSGPVPPTAGRPFGQQLDPLAGPLQLSARARRRPRAARRDRPDPDAPTYAGRPH